MGIRFTRSSRRKDRMRRRRVNPGNHTKKANASRGSMRPVSSMPPVMVRGLDGGAAVGNSKAFNRSRRRIDVPLNVPGAEVRLPSVPRVNIGWRVLSLLLVCLCAYAIYQVWETDTYRVDLVEVNGLTRVTSMDLNTYLGISGEPIFTLNPASIEKDLSNAFSEFSSVSVSVALPNTVAITVTERVPVLVWNVDEKNLLIDQNGSVFPARDGLFDITQYPIVHSQEVPGDINYGSSMPLASGELELNRYASNELIDDQGTAKAKQKLSPEMVSTILILDEYAPEGAILHFDDLHGLSWKDRRGWEVYFGSVNDIEMKLSVFKAIFNKLKMDEVRPEFISVEFVHNPYYRLAE